MYNRQLQDITLPDKIVTTYTLVSCLKQTEHKSIYFLENKSGNLFIMKTGTGKQFQQIKHEHDIFDILANISDIAVPKLVDYWEENNVCYLIRTYVAGSSLADYFERRLYLSDEEIVVFMLKICKLVQMLHSQTPPIIHRDIKPENFILEKGTGILYLIDFDTARIYTPDKSRDTQLIGTPSHAAPEQLSGALEYDFFQYQDMVNQIILDYYNYDMDNLSKDCENLVEVLYQDEAIMEIPAIDYFGYDEIPDFVFFPFSEKISDSLAYNNNLLKRNLDSYSEYATYIYRAFQGYLDPNMTDTANGLYIYATETGQTAIDSYGYALAGVLINLVCAFETAEGRATPIY